MALLSPAFVALESLNSSAPALQSLAMESVDAALVSASPARAARLRVMSFNANGIRSVASKGFFEWFAAEDVDVLCLQETKAQETQLTAEVFRPAGYHRFLKEAATKKGYSGVGIYSRKQPDEVLTSLGIPVFDDEGRYIEARFGALSVVSLYVPSGSSGDVRQRFKFEMMEGLEKIFEQWRGTDREYILCGDWNIVHTELDIKNWRSNQKNSGCLPEERAWLGKLFEQAGWVDTFRVLRPNQIEYTWWSNRGAARANNVGWRIDYQIVSPGLRAQLLDCAIHPTPRFSDHAPYVVDYAL